MNLFGFLSQYLNENKCRPTKNFEGKGLKHNGYIHVYVRKLFDNIQGAFFTGFELLVAWHSVKGFWRIRSQPIHQGLEFKTITKFALLWGNCERHGAKQNELVVKSLFSQLCTGFQTTKYLGSYLFFRRGLWNKKNVLNWPYNRYPGWTGPTRPR